MVTVRDWIIHDVHNSPHKDRNMKICVYTCMDVCVCVCVYVPAMQCKYGDISNSKIYILLDKIPYQIYTSSTCAG